MNFDISQLLEQWDYEPGQVVVRRFKGKDGMDKIQLRLDLGLLQMNTEGRPDGKRPYGHASLLEHYQAQLQRHITSKGSETGFVLNGEDCAKLQQEAIQFHHRYICLFQLGDFEAVVRDTTRNLEAFDFVQRFAEVEELAWALQQFRPQLTMMRLRASGALKLQENKHDEVIQMVEEGIDELKTFLREHGRGEGAEHIPEVHSLDEWLSEIKANRPLSEREKLETALDEAVRREDYEEAAKVRDALKNLKT